MIIAFFIVIFILVLPFAVVQAARDTSKKEKEEAIKAEREESLSTRFSSLCDRTVNSLKASGWEISKFISCMGAALIVDDAEKRWCAVLRETMKDTKSYAYSDIIRYEVQENGQSIGKSDGSTAAAGALLFGVTGAVVGAAASTNTVTKKCTSLRICMSVNDISNPLIVFDFVQKPLDTNSEEYQKTIKSVNELAATLDYIMSKAKQ